MWNLSSPSRNGLCTLHWEHGVLTTRLPGKSHKWLIINIDDNAVQKRGRNPGINLCTPEHYEDVNQIAEAIENGDKRKKFLSIVHTKNMKGL